MVFLEDLAEGWRRPRRQVQEHAVALGIPIHGQYLDAAIPCDDVPRLWRSVRAIGIERVPVLHVGALAWAAAAACQAYPADWWHPEGRKWREDQERALAVCQGCTVRAECRALADEWERTAAATLGVWGGESPEDRLARRRQEAHSVER